MVDFDEHKLAALARELAMNIREINTIFAEYNIDETDFYEISKIPFFQRVKEQYTIEWNSALSTAERLKVKSLALAEEGLPVMGLRMLDRQEPLPAAADVFKTFLKTGGIGEAKAAGGNGAERFVITINLGADADGKPVIEHYDKPLAVSEPTPVATRANGAEKSMSLSQNRGEITPKISIKCPLDSAGELTPAETAALESLMNIEE